MTARKSHTSIIPIHDVAVNHAIPTDEHDGTRFAVAGKTTAEEMQQACPAGLRWHTAWRIDATEFVGIWKACDLTQRSGAQQHFLDICELLGHPKPAEVNLKSESFTFEKGASKQGGGDGWADVWKKGFFGWEYKGKHKDLDAAYGQLQQYRESLENPPLLVVCDMEHIVVHTNFTSTKAQGFNIPLAELDTPRNLEILRASPNDIFPFAGSFPTSAALRSSWVKSASRIFATEDTFVFRFCRINLPATRTRAKWTLDDRYRTKFATGVFAQDDSCSWLPWLMW